MASVEATSGDSRHNEDSATGGCDNASESLVNVQSRPQHMWNPSSVHPFTGDPSGMRIQDVPYVKKNKRILCLVLSSFSS
jgi:hypothetical protein